MCIYFDQMVNRIYPTEFQLNKANSSDTEAPFLDLNLYIFNGTLPTKIYDKWDGFDSDIVGQGRKLKSILRGHNSRTFCRGLHTQFVQSAWRLPLPLGVWEGLRFVIVALPGLFSYLFS